MKEKPPLSLKQQDSACSINLDAAYGSSATKNIVADFLFPMSRELESSLFFPIVSWDRLYCGWTGKIGDSLRASSRSGKTALFMLLLPYPVSQHLVEGVGRKLGEADTPRQYRCLGAVPQIELFEDMAHMVFYCFLRKDHAVRHLCVAEALGEPVKDLLLTGGQVAQLVAFIPSPGHGGKDPCCGLGVHIGLPPGGGPYGGKEFKLARRLEYETEYSGS